MNVRRRGLVKRRYTAEQVYAALFEIDALREEVRVLRDQLSAAAAARFVRRLDDLEVAAIRLLAGHERRRAGASH